MSDSDRVPLMYRAQLEGRGKIQYAGDERQAENKSPATTWVNQWLEGCPPVTNTQQENNNIRAAALQRTPQRRPTRYTVKMPQFGAGVQTWEYTLSWRLVTNSGQDEGVIRPVIGAKGLPYYPGSSMKGAFLRACQRMCTPAEMLEYCGGEVEEIVGGIKQRKTRPGILRFHGGYPLDMSWGNRERLLDVVHSQEKRQVMDNVTTSANVQISLYQTKFKFGISSTQRNVDWNRVREIWEQALSEGIGSRVSAGYGRFKEVEDTNRVILSVNLCGQGLASTLLNKTPEFRPNMFKAALRGHTLRLLAGVTDEETAQRLTKQLWGGISEGNEEDGAIVGKLGINFNLESLIRGEHNYSPNGRRASPMPIYNLKSGRLDILSVGEVSVKEREFLIVLIKFSLLLGGFGKSWRRIHHGLFYNEYFRNQDKPMIGCHWAFSKLLEDFCITAPRGELDNIINFLSNIPEILRSCFDLPLTRSHVTYWREVWHPQRVQVWGRIAENKFDSQSVEWFHQNNFIKGTELTGRIGNKKNPSQVSRIWQRMYPLYVKTAGTIKHKRNDDNECKYVEIITIFTPDNSRITRDFLQFIAGNSNSFQKLWGGER